MASIPLTQHPGLHQPDGHQSLQQSASGNDAAPESEAGSHKRTYQACIACRRRKVKCDRGPVDTPIDGPCKRCKREKKECTFSETRKKRKRGDDPNASSDDDLDEDFRRRNGRSRTAHGTLIAPYHGSPYNAYGATPQVDGRAAPNGLPEPIHGPSRVHLANIRRPNSLPQNTVPQNLSNEAAATLLNSPINNPGEALYLLVDAAKRSEDMERQRGNDGGKRASENDNKGVARGQNSPIDPAITNEVQDQPTEAQRAVTQAALQAWSRLRFVHAGWFTSKEAMEYVEYYYQFLAPMTPISIPDFRSPASHPKFLSEEPMLVVTILAIASRFKKLEGAAAESRSYSVHDKLWVYLQSMITRMFWGQEQFGGGFCGAGSSVVAGLRALGTVESLLLLSDWHPRAMHFPPGDDGNDILLPLLKDEGGSHTPLQQKTSVEWAEPAIRSDRMCWSLIGCAYTLAFELGVFDCLSTLKVWEPRNDPAFERSNRVGRLLYIYVGLITGKLGFPNMLPQSVRAAHGSAYLKMVMPGEISSGVQSQDDISGNVQRAWAEIISLMRATNEEMFATPARIGEIVRSRSYFGMLQKYKPMLEEWLTRFQQLQIPPQARTVLLMEYEYMRAFCNSLALQAVLDECAMDTSITNPRSVSPMPPDAGSTPPALLSSRLVDVMRMNAPYINEVTDASRKLLQHAVSGLSRPTMLLKHVPNRTYFRVLSCAMFLLKTFALGGKSDEVEISLRLLKSTIEALREGVVDDVHLCNRIAAVLEELTRTIAKKFVIITVPGPPDSVRTAVGRALGSPDAVKKSPSVTSPSRSQTHHRPSSSQARSSFASPPRSTSSRLHPSRTSFPDDLYSGSLAGIAVSAIDPNDARFTIMPPPDFVFHGSGNAQNPGQREDAEMSSYAYPPPTQEPMNNSIYSQLSYAANEPHYEGSSGYNAQGEIPETTFNSPPSNAATNLNANSNANRGASYSWMALDLQNYGNPQSQQALNTRPSSTYGSALNSGTGYGGEGGDGFAGWGAFGPEISGSLETLGLLGEGFPGMGMGVGLGMGPSGLDGGVWQERG